MKIRELPFEGHYEENSTTTSEILQIAAPENDVDVSVLSWALLPHSETVEDDSARQGYLFEYEVREHLDNGLFTLQIRARDQSNRTHGIEIAAGLVSSVAAEPYRQWTFIPMWFISKHLHYKPLTEEDRDHYPGTAFGRLILGDPAILPQRRLFGATV